LGDCASVAVLKEPVPAVPVDAFAQLYGLMVAFLTLRSKFSQLLQMSNAGDEVVEAFRHSTPVFTQLVAASSRNDQLSEADPEQGDRMDCPGEV
jgi:hypothetical protein